VISYRVIEWVESWNVIDQLVIEWVESWNVIKQRVIARAQSWNVIHKHGIEMHHKTQLSTTLDMASLALDAASAPACDSFILEKEECAYSSTEESRYVRRNPLPPTPLLFDDGSRIMRESTVATANGDNRIRQNDEKGDCDTNDSNGDNVDSVENPRGTVSIREYYEIDRLVDEIRSIPSSTRHCCAALPVVPTTSGDACDHDTKDSNEWTHRIALQFPDSQLCDAPLVLWEFQAALTLHERQEANDEETVKRQYLLCILGDTTFAACCPDTVAAAHVSATILIHYGHACLSSHHHNCHVLYSFGKQNVDIDQCVRQVQDVLSELSITSPRDASIDVSGGSIRESDTAICATAEQGQQLQLLLLYQVQYHHVMPHLATTLQALGNIDWNVLIGRVPVTCTVATSTTTMPSHAVAATTRSSSCCQRNPPSVDTGNPIQPQSCCDSTDKATSCGRSRDDAAQDSNLSATAVAASGDGKESADVCCPTPIVVGGLELPLAMEWSNCIVLYIGDDSSPQFRTIALRFFSTPDHRPLHLWTWSPQLLGPLQRGPSSSLSRILSRRFYLVQKAQQCRVFGILVAHVTPAIQEVVVSLRRVLAPRTSYTFVVGKINPAKLANFPEIECFILTACPEHSLLSNERELFHVPIITPAELLVALGVTDWGTAPYSTHPSDYWSSVAALLPMTLRHDHVGVGVPAARSISEEADHLDDDSDAPYFSLVTGTYQSKHHEGRAYDGAADVESSSKAMIEYRSAAGEFLGQREYQGLVLATNPTIAGDGDTNGSKPAVVHAALPGQFGIASNYTNR
jgi:diphthamide biosynthesis protein 2